MAASMPEVTAQYISPLSIRHSPVLEPPHVAVVPVGSLHTPADRDEVDVEPDDNGVQNTINSVLHRLACVAQEPVGQKAEGKDGEVQGWIIVVDISNTSHDDEGKVVKKPADDGIDTSVMDLINLVLRELLIASLPADSVPGDKECEDAKTCSGAPVDKGVAQEKVLDSLVIPATHTKANVKEGPLPPLGGKVVLLVRVGNQGVVGSHHGNILIVLEFSEKR